MYAIDFEYANRRLSEFGCVVCYINSTASEEVSIGCDITFNTVKNSHSSVHSVTSSSYDNVYTTTFDIIKDVCNSNVDDIYLTPLEVRTLVKWLNRREYFKFKVLSADEEDVSYYGSFNVKEILVGNNIVGLTLTFTSNAPYGFGDTLFLEFDINDANENFYIYGDGDEYGIIYPKVEITCLSEGDLEITNITTNNIIEIKGCNKKCSEECKKTCSDPNANEVITIDGEHKIITSNKPCHTTLANDFNYNYFDILNDDNENIYKASMPCKIKVSYSPIKKVGVL